MKKFLVGVALAALIAVAAVAAVVRAGGPGAAEASSHREAPLISEDPSADNTDLYAFRSPDKPDTFTIVSNWIPAEDPAAGPNYYTFSPSARYNINIDRTGDGKADIVYRVQFKRNPGPLFLGDTVQPYTVTRISGGTSSVVATGSTPPNNIGPRTTPNYRDLAAKAVTSLQGGGSVFAGQREDAFFGDIGAVFDLVAIRKGFDNGGKDFFAGYGVHAIALQLPISQFDTASHVVGIWASTERPVVQTTLQRVKRGKKTTFRLKRTTVYKQVSRLGNPLFNELIVPTTMKDKWNAGTPTSDKAFEQFVREPILAKVLNQLYKVNAPETGRDDLVQVLLTGVPNLNSTGTALADMLRLNLSTPVTAADKASRLGVLGGDVQGYPNGRRLTDDVIDISEQAVAGFLKGNKVPLGDGVNTNDVANLGVFPYENDPPSGFDNTKGQQKP